MEVILLEQAQKDRDYWKESGNKAIMHRITALLEDIMKHPYTGIGKPEELKYGLEGKWSRRITSKHRLIYSVNEEIIMVYTLYMKSQ